jgi:two-component system sensor histidine kinase/response regulator
MDAHLSNPIDGDTSAVATESSPALAGRAEPGGPLSPTAPIHLDEMRERLGDDDDLVAEVMSLFLEDCPVRLAQIKTAVEQRDREAIRTSAHALKGAAGNLSAAPVARCALALERMALDGDIDPVKADGAWACLEAESARLIEVLEAGLNVGVRHLD